MAAIIDALALRTAFLKSDSTNTATDEVLCLYQQMRYDSATMHQQQCTVQPAERIVQEAMDNVPKMSDVPAKYEVRVREAMNALHRPSRAIRTEANDKKGSPKNLPSSCNAPVVSPIIYKSLSPITAIAIVLTIVIAMSQQALGFKFPIDRKHFHKVWETPAPVPLLRTMAGGGLLGELTERHGFTPIRAGEICKRQLVPIIYPRYLCLSSILIFHSLMNMAATTLVVQQ